MAENDSCIKRSAIILTAFGLFFVTWYFNLGVRPFANFISTCKSIHYILHYLIAGIIPAAALLLLHRPDTILYRLGLTHGFGRGLLFGVLSTVPMFAGYAVIGSFNRETPPDHMFTFIVVAGFFEELIFRGFVFGELFRTARWGFLPAATLTALAFGSLHLYQGDDLISASAAFGPSRIKTDLSARTGKKGPDFRHAAHPRGNTQRSQDRVGAPELPHGKRKKKGCPENSGQPLFRAFYLQSP